MKVMKKKSPLLLAVLLSSNLLVGCGTELPFVGNLQDKIIPLLDTVENAVEPLKGVIRPLRERFFPRKKRTSRTARRLNQDPSQPANDSSGEDEDAPPAQPSPTPVPQNPEQKKTEANMTFDHWRTLGIRKLYEGETLEAIADFKKAHAIKPNDANIQDWIFLAENPGAGQKRPGESLPPDPSMFQPTTAPGKSF
ncbi:MAG TPA: hypothetical protein DD435_02255 [Cyanobacteria bacterium UBA8530]|nr:hypothetical protein [Cyanobacteria bacterium UBA8530]